MRKSFSAGIPALVVLGLALSACGSSDPADTEAMADTVVVPNEQAALPAPTATAPLALADGTSVGTVTATVEDSAIKIVLSADGLEPGERGVHVHTTGKCEGPAFASAGGHWNIGEKQHGIDNPQGQHAGDMPNLVIGADGKGQLEYTLKGGSFAELMDEDGAAFVIHAGKDDQVTDPSGDSGDRVACGVFAAA